MERPTSYERLRGWLDPLRLALVLHLASLAAGAMVLLRVNRLQWFVADDWGFFNNRLDGFGKVLFLPHNEHWTTIPILVYRALYSVFGLRSYTPYAVVLVAVHLVAAHLVWRVMRRIGVDPLLASASVAVFTVLGAGAQNLLWSFQIGFVASVALGMLHILLVDHTGSFGRRDVAGLFAAVAGLMCSGITVTMVAVAGIVVALRRGPRQAVQTVVPPALVYVAWLQWVGKEGLGSHPTTLQSILDVPAYVWTGLATTFETGLGIPGAGAFLTLLLLAWVIRNSHVVRAPTAAGVALALGAAGMFIIVGLGRSALGSEQAGSTRYVYIAFALLLPLLGLVLSQLTEGMFGRQVVVAGLFGMALLHNLGELRTTARAESVRELASRDRILAAARIGRSNEPTLSEVPEPVNAPDLTMATVARFDRDDALPRNSIDEVDLLAAAAQLQVALSDAPPTTAGAPPPVIAGSRNVTVVPAGPDCTSLTPSGPEPRVELRFAGPAAVRMRSPDGGNFEILLRSRSDKDVLGPPRSFIAAAGEDQWLDVSRRGDLALTLPGGGTLELCGLPASGDTGRG